MKRVALASLIVATLGGCATLPAPRPQPQPKAAYAAEQSFAAPVASWPADLWWHDYRDAQLDALITEALEGSPSMAVARARLERARSNAQISGAALSPQVSANGSITEQKQSRNYLTPASATPEGWNDYGRATLDFSWELDFWGKNRAALAAAASELRAPRRPTRQARLVLATAWRRPTSSSQRLMRALDSRAARGRRVQERPGPLRDRFDNGLETRPALGRPRPRPPAAAPSCRSRRAIALARNQLAALLGRARTAASQIAGPLRMARPLLRAAQRAGRRPGRRPDIVARGWRVEAAGSASPRRRPLLSEREPDRRFIGVQSLAPEQSWQPELRHRLASARRFSCRSSTADACAAHCAAPSAEYDEAVASYDRAVDPGAAARSPTRPPAAAARRRWSRAGDAVGQRAEAYALAGSAIRAGWRLPRRARGRGRRAREPPPQTDLQTRALALDVALVRALGGGFDSDLRLTSTRRLP